MIKIETTITANKIRKAEKVLIDNGIEADEAQCVLQAIGYSLLNTELYGNEVAYKMHKYYQPKMHTTGDVPSGLASFHVFRTRQECILWMESLGYAPATYEIKEYSGNDIEDPTFVDIKTQL